MKTRRESASFLQPMIRTVGSVVLTGIVGLSANAQEARVASLPDAAGTIWSDRPKPEPHAAVAPIAALAKSRAQPELVYIGAASPELRRVADRLLNESRPCAAFALLHFKPSKALADGSWRMVLSGIPAPVTLDVVVEANQTAVDDPSMRTVWGHPYEIGQPYYVEISVTTENAGEDRFVSTVVSRLAGGEGQFLTAGTLVERPVRFAWSKPEYRLLRLYDAVE